MVMGECVGVEEIDENRGLANPATRNERIREVIIGHCIVINPQNLVDLDFGLVNFMLVPGLFSKNPQPKLAIIRVDHSIVLVIRILLYLFNLDVLIDTPANFLFKSELLSLHGVHLDPRLVLVSLGYCNGPCRVSRDNHCLDGVHCAHLALLKQVREDLRVRL